jgi:L-lactate dehydrogenase complex protein LldG
MTGRDDVLRRIRSALADGPAAEEIPRTYRRQGDLSPGDPALLDRLDDRLTDYRANVHRTTTDRVADAVAVALTDGLRGDRAPAGTGQPRVVVPPGLPAAWLAAADADVLTDDGLTVDTLDTCDGVVTAVAVAVADTGTIVLDGAPDQGRRAITLVPDLHVCIVRAEQIVETVPEAVARLDPTRPLTWISGPSATSDIELDRVEGVHGPRTLSVVLLTA